MKLWERSLAQALGQAEAARTALLNVRGHIMPEEARAALREAMDQLDTAIVIMREEVAKYEVHDVSVPWERAL